MGVPLTEKLTQQLSAGRLMVTEASITEFVDECVIPELDSLQAAGKRLTLNDVSGLDEWWFDVNKALNGRVVGPEGEDFRQEVPTERSGHVTVFSGALGCSTTPGTRISNARWEAERSQWEDDGWAPEAFEMHRPRPTPPPSHTLLDKVYVWMNQTLTKCDLDDSDYALLDQVHLGSWDSESFFLWPVLVLFARQGGANPAWTRFARSDKMLVGTTPDGWMTEDWKLKHYEACRTYPFSPLHPDYKRNIIDQRDGHFSNLTVELSQKMEEDGNTFLITPGHHTGVLQVPDVRGGPNFHANRLSKLLMRRENRAGNVLDEATQVRCIEIAVAVSHNPHIWTAGQRRVGWTEKIADDAITLSYDPLATADRTLITQSKASEALLDAGRQRALRYTPDTKPALLRQSAVVVCNAVPVAVDQSVPNGMPVAAAQPVLEPAKRQKV